MLNSKPLTWEQVKPIWDTELWPSRDSEPVTSMKYLGGYDMAFKETKPYFIGVEIEDKIIAVNSYVQTYGTEWRSRGLWVHPEHRGEGYAKMVLEHTKDAVKKLGGTRIWTMPREQALGAYQSAGFIRTTGWKHHEWGKNCYAIASLLSLSDIGKESTAIRENRIAFFHEHLEPLIGLESIDRITLEEFRVRTKPLSDAEEENWR